MNSVVVEWETIKELCNFCERTDSDLPVELIRSEFVQRLYKNWKRSDQQKNLNLKFFKDSEIVLRYNDFPYPFEFGISHFVLWIHPKLNTDFYLGSRMPKFYKDKLEELLKNYNYSEYVYFRNSINFQSIKEIPHYHVIVKK